MQMWRKRGSQLLQLGKVEVRDLKKDTMRAC
jgi:hypothetical protein